MRFVWVLLMAAEAARGQWTVQEVTPAADLRGIHSLDRRVAWASGTRGTVLRTVDGGVHWQACAVPVGAEKLDFRAVQGFDPNTALVMSSGTGDLSRIYKTTDGCQSWRLVFSNPDKAGFWDAMRFDGPRAGVLIGDPVDGQFPVFVSADSGDTWKRFDSFAIALKEPNQSLFAASNTSMLLDRKGQRLRFATGGGTTSLVTVELGCRECLKVSDLGGRIAVGAAAGGFSVAARGDVLVVVGGDYKNPAQLQGTSATWTRGEWKAAEAPPGGYRSCVVYDAAAKQWIAAGPTGTDVSSDDGLHWRALIPGPADAKEADKHWNAISLPFAVGPHGRIGKWRAGASR